MHAAATTCRNAAAGLLLTLAATASSSTAAAPPLRGPRVADGVLDRVRGGTATPDGRLVVSFAITRTVTIDGRTVETTALDAAALLAVQRGSGSTAAVGLPATVVQNTLSGGQIGAVTAIDVTATALRAWEAWSLQQMLDGAVAASLRR